MSKTKSLSQSKNFQESESTVKLPYLKSGKPLVYLSDEPSHSHRGSFNNHATKAELPRYDPEKDKNLSYFFDKPSNRKLL